MISIREKSEEAQTQLSVCLFISLNVVQIPALEYDEIKEELVGKNRNGRDFCLSSEGTRSFGLNHLKQRTITSCIYRIKASIVFVFSLEM